MSPRPSLLPHLSPTRALSVSLRTVHLVAFGLVVGGVTYDVALERLALWLVLTVLTGSGLILLELCTIGVSWFFLGKGVLVLAKLLVLMTLPLFWQARVPLLLLVVAIAGVSAHLPGRYRHYSLLHHQVEESRT